MAGRQSFTVEFWRLFWTRLSDELQYDLYLRTRGLPPISKLSTNVPYLAVSSIQLLPRWTRNALRIENLMSARL